MANLSEFSLELETEWNKVPEDVKQLVPAATTAVTIVIKSVSDYSGHCQHDNLLTLHSLVSTTKTAAKPQVEKILNTCQHKFIVIASERENYAAAAQCCETADPRLITSLKDCIHESANRALGVGCALSMVGLVCEALKLYSFGTEIGETELFLNETFNEWKALIQAKLDQLPSDIDKFVEGMEQCFYEKFTDSQRLRLLARKTRERDELRKKMDGIEKEIGKLEKMVNDKTGKLNSYRKSAVPSAFTQALQGIFLFISWRTYGPDAGSGHNTGTFLTTIGLFLASLTGLKLERVSGTTVHRLTKKLLEIQQLRDRLEDMQANIERIFNDFNDSNMQENN